MRAEGDRPTIRRPARLGAQAYEHELPRRLVEHLAKEVARQVERVEVKTARLDVAIELVEVIKLVVGRHAGARAQHLDLIVALPREHLATLVGSRPVGQAGQEALVGVEVELEHQRVEHRVLDEPLLTQERAELRVGRIEVA